MEERNAIDSELPTLDAINDVSIGEDSPEQIVNLTGISAGGSGLNFLRVTASSSNPELIPHPKVSYDSLATTGTLAFTPVPGAKGTATIAVAVEAHHSEDDSGTTNDSVRLNRTFDVHIKKESLLVSFTIWFCSWFWNLGGVGWLLVFIGGSLGLGWLVWILVFLGNLKAHIFTLIQIVVGCILFYGFLYYIVSLLLFYCIWGCRKAALWAVGLPDEKGCRAGDVPEVYFSYVHRKAAALWFKAVGKATPSTGEDSPDESS